MIKAFLGPTSVCLSVVLCQIAIFETCIKRSLGPVKEIDGHQSNVIFTTSVTSIYSLQFINEAYIRRYPSCKMKDCQAFSYHMFSDDIDYL